MKLGASAVFALAVVASVACDEQFTGGIQNPHADATITLQNNYFDPASVTINAGDTVLFVWPGSTHNVYFDGTPGSPAPCTNMAIGDCYRVFAVPGTFNFTCTLHPGMDGMITVK